MTLVVALMGLPGAGKTPAARILAGALDARVISRDAIRAAMFDPPTFSDAEKQAAFEAQLVALGVTLEQGTGAILDGVPFARSEQLERVRAVTDGHGARLVPVLLDVPVAVAQARVADAASDRPPADRSPEDVAEIASRFEAPPPETLVIDASPHDPERVAAAILERLEVP